MASITRTQSWNNGFGSLVVNIEMPEIAFNTAEAISRYESGIRAIIKITGEKLLATSRAAYASTPNIAAKFGQFTGDQPPTIRLVNTDPIFPFVEYPTRAHTITATRAPFLVFKVDGRWVKVRSVSHPGTKGKLAIDGLVDAASNEMIDKVNQLIGEILS